MKEQKKLYLKVSPFRDYDTYYYPLTSKDKTWKEILNLIEDNLEDQYLENNDTLEGLKLNFEIVKELPSYVEMDEYD